MNCDELEDLAGALALGAVLPAEDITARQHIATCNRDHSSVRTLAATAQLLALAAPPVEPPARLRHAILAAIQAEPATARRPPAESAGGGTPAGTASAITLPAAGRRAVPVESSSIERPLSLRPRPDEPALPPPVSPPPPITRIDATTRQRRALPGWLAAAAALLVVAGLGAWNLRLQNQLNQRDDRLARQQRTIDAIAGGDSVAFLPNGPQLLGARASVILPAEGPPLAVFERLAPPRDGGVYQLWVIRGGQPQDLGLITPDAGGRTVITLPEVRGADVIAVTIEPRHVAQPTGPQVLVAPITL